MKSSKFSEEAETLHNKSLQALAEIDIAKELNTAVTVGYNLIKQLTIYQKLRLKP